MDDVARLNVVEVLLHGRREYLAFFVLNFESAILPGADPETQMAVPITGQIEIEAEREVVWVASGTTTNLLDGAAVPQGVIQRGLERVGDKAKTIEKITFPGTVRANEER